MENNYEKTDALLREAMRSTASPGAELLITLKQGAADRRAGVKNAGIKRFTKAAAVFFFAAIGLSTVIYAERLADFGRAVFRTVTVPYTQIAYNGDEMTRTGSYYLEAPIDLGGGDYVEDIIFTYNKLEIICSFTDPLANIFFTSDPDSMYMISIKNACILTDKDGVVYNGGYGVTFSPQNERIFFLAGKEGEAGDDSYSFVPSPELTLTIGGLMFDIMLAPSGTTSADTGFDRADSPYGIEWAELKYRLTDPPDSGNLQITADFTDRLELLKVGRPENTDIYVSRELSAVIKSGTGGEEYLKTQPLTAYGEDGGIYTFAAPLGSVTVFKPDAAPPIGKTVSMEVPCIIIEYKGGLPLFSVELPAVGAVIYPELELSLKTEEIVLKSVERTSETTAELVFVLNAGEGGQTAVLDPGFNSRYAGFLEYTVENGVCTLNAVFKDRAADTLELGFQNPVFAVYGGWTISLE